jgi:hypothetical protein
LPRHGADAIGVRVKPLVSEGSTVMVEQISNSSIRGHPISAVVMAVFEPAV